jgi:hypothetical protein
MRVAWQAGAIGALVESGLTFQHADGTSGGIMNLAMLLSGLSPVEMGERWSTLDVKRFSSLRSFADYVKGPWQLPALGDADGVVDHVFPHLGIDVERIHAARDAIAPIVQRIRRAGDDEVLAQHLVLALDDRAGVLARVVDRPPAVPAVAVAAVARVAPHARMTPISRVRSRIAMTMVLTTPIAATSRAIAPMPPRTKPRIVKIRTWPST